MTGEGAGGMIERYVWRIPSMEIKLGCGKVWEKISHNVDNTRWDIEFKVELTVHIIESLRTGVKSMVMGHSNRYSSKNVYDLTTRNSRTLPQGLIKKN